RFLERQILPNFHRPGEVMKSETAPHAASEPEKDSLHSQPHKINALRRVLGLIASPGETFKEIRRRPTWLAPLVIAAAAITVGNIFYYLRANPDWEQRARARIEQHEKATGEITPQDQAEKQIAFSKTLGQGFIVLPIITLPLICFFLAGVYYVCFGMVFLNTPSYKQTLSVVAWSAAAYRVVVTLVLITVLLVISNDKIKELDPTPSSLVLSNLGSFLPRTTPAAIKSLAASLDLFTIWFLSLLTIGFTKMAEHESRTNSVLKTGAVVFGLWLVWVFARAGMAAVF